METTAPAPRQHRGRRRAVSVLRDPGREGRPAPSLPDARRAGRRACSRPRRSACPFRPAPSSWWSPRAAAATAPPARRRRRGRARVRPSLNGFVTQSRRPSRAAATEARCELASMSASASTSAAPSPTWSAVDDAGRVSLAKSASTPADPSIGVLDGLDPARRRARASTAARCSADTGLIVHGTTVATNALLERKGAKVGMLTTAGHRDVDRDARGPEGRPLQPAHGAAGARWCRARGGST